MLAHNIVDQSWRLSNDSKIYKIIDKKRKSIFYKANEAQSEIIRVKDTLKRAGLSQWLIILKARQMGITTGECVYNLDRTYWNKNVRSWMMAHKLKTVSSIFSKMHYAYSHMPEHLRIDPKFRSRNELFWPQTNSSIQVTCDPTGETVDNLHVCELALVQNAEEKLPQFIQGVPKEGSVVYESTAYGVGGYFYDTWQSAWEARKKPGSFEFYPIFLPWTICNEYRDFSPLVGAIDDYEKDLKKHFGLDDSQLQWRRKKIAGLRGKVDLFRQYYPMNPEEAFIASGLPVFDQEILHAMLPHCRQPKLKYWRGGELRIYKEREKTQYLISCDTSEGDGKDKSAAVVMNLKDGSIAAVLHGKMSPNDLGRYLVRVACHFNGAVIAVERNNHGHSVLNTIQNQEHYENVYRHRDYDQRGGRVRKKVGFPTSVKTRPMLIDDLDEAICDESIDIPDEEMMHEFMQFQIRDGKPQHPENGHDDLVMAMGIAVHLRKRAKILDFSYPDISQKPAGL